METLIDVNRRANAPIYLTGFSGAGKSTVGESLAFCLGRKFFDLDKEIELLSGFTIANFIKEQGESKFRDFEAQILASLCHTESSVVALGGGALLRQSSLDKVRNSGCLIYLKSSLVRIRQNLESQKTVRPLIRSSDDIEMLFEQREPSYLKSDIVLLVETQSVKEVSDQLVERHAAWVQHNTLN